MKKIILFFACIAPILAAAQMTSLPQKESFSLGLNANLTNISEHDTQRMAYGMYLSLYNLYIDFTIAPAEHRNSLGVKYWRDEERIFNVNAGYRIKIYKNIGITPLIGITQYEVGDVDGYDWSVGNNGNIVNSFNVKYSKTLFNYGGCIDYTQFFGNFGLKVGLVAQRYTYGAIFGFSMAW
jgi:hypothetical protein